MNSGPMAEFAKKKGKEGTRGAKQIASENQETIQFYRNMILGSNGIYFTVMTLLRAPYTATEVVMFFVAAVIYIASYQFFARTATPKFGPKKEVLDPGLDLNMAEGMAEHVKDLVILTSGTQVQETLSLMTYVHMNIFLSFTSPGTFTVIQLRVAIIASCAGEGVHDGVEERHLAVALRPGPRRNGNGRQETEENGPQNEENEIDKGLKTFYGRSRFVQ